MILSLKATEEGKLHQSLSAGAIVAPGQLLAKLDLTGSAQVVTLKSAQGVGQRSAFRVVTFLHA